MKKFELTNEYIKRHEKKLYRIKALKDFGYIKAGELGGYLENEFNLNQAGSAWVSDEACVMGYARINGNACVCGNAMIIGNAIIAGEACVGDNAFICNNAQIFGEACIGDRATVSGNAMIFENALIMGNAFIFDEARIYGNARIYNNAKVFNTARVCGKAKVYKNAQIYGNALITGNANIKYKTDYIHIEPFLLGESYINFAKSEDNTILVNCELFNGNVIEFEKMLKAFDEEEAKAYMLAIELAKEVIEL